MWAQHMLQDPLVGCYSAKTITVMVRNSNVSCILVYKIISVEANKLVQIRSN